MLRVKSTEGAVLGWFLGACATFKIKKKKGGNPILFTINFVNPKVYMCL